MKIREQIVEFLKTEFIGPDPQPPHIENDEEILTQEPPRQRYIAGILFPQESKIGDADITDSHETEMLEENLAENDDDPMLVSQFVPSANREGIDEEDDFEDTIGLANSFLPSAMGFSCFVEIPAGGFVVSINAGRYHTKKISQDNDSTKEKTEYHRESIDTVLTIPANGLPNKNEREKTIALRHNETEIGLVLNIQNRRLEKQAEGQLFTFTLINQHKHAGSSVKNKDCFFQVSFSIRATDNSSCFLPYPSAPSIHIDNDQRSSQLLYRNYQTFAVGHGCAPSWTKIDDGQRASAIKTDVLPVFQMPLVVPATFDNLSLSMFDMSEWGDASFPENSLETLCTKYENWIKAQETKAQDLAEEFQAVAQNHLNHCKKCLARMRAGIELIRKVPQVKTAFMLMNEAMLTQQLRYGLKLWKWEPSGKGNTQQLSVEPLKEPQLDKPETWPSPNNDYGTWRPFQIGFILMNLNAMAEPIHEERQLVDLIWFPTGGGKTEAYLGLTAFTIFLNRLKGIQAEGTTVLMRYTLRLLTTQQYQRATSLICACEAIRQERKDLHLGNTPITIGLWVGSGLTPNNQKEAVKAFNKMNKGDTQNPFVILKCPWCGVQMGVVKSGRSTRIKGYCHLRPEDKIIFRCDDRQCHFSDEKSPLPLQVIDEEIYKNPPTLIIGTVDKFAMLPWLPQANSLFGFREHGRIAPPSLIIQDELHLISGPLGSMVGHYEMLIAELCKWNGRKPKIVASTATISRAAEQCHALYNCGQENVFLFPPQCLEAHQSFFATLDPHSPGRLYLGVYASASPSALTTQARVFAALLQSIQSAEVEEESERNPYWTLLNYFNTIRELGQAETLLSGNVGEYLKAMWHRKQIVKTEHSDPRRFLNNLIELTSRISSDRISERLQDLAVDYPSNDSVDVCLATNMVSVGVDISRLGLMAVTGQPKTTSEYIQATSRVGRSKEGPGLIVVIYNTARPRDRSHYERFRTYHETIYSQVEPTSVTPFSAPVRERALHALLVAWIRLVHKNHSQSPRPIPQEETFEQFSQIVKQWVADVDPDEEKDTLKLLKKRIEDWQRLAAGKYGDFQVATEERPLMYPAGTRPSEVWEDEAWQTPTSMRNVDATCEAKVVGRYSDKKED